MPCPFPGMDLFLEMPPFFEFDLLRGGERLPMAGPLPKGDYSVYAGRVGRRPRGQIMAWSLRWPLPAVPIPLLPPLAPEDEAWVRQRLRELETSRGD